MKKITGSLLVCTGAGVFAATALLVGPVTSKQPASPTPVAAAAAPPITAADGGPVDQPGHGGHGASSANRSTAADGASATGSANGSANGPANGPANGSATVRISGFAFETQAVSPGATVTVVNTDQAPHTVTAQDGSFAASVPAGGTTTFVAPNRAGSFAFFCEIHPQMTGTLTVR